MPLQRDQPRAREKPRTALSVCQKVIVKNLKSITSNFLQMLFILQSSSRKWMNTLMLTGREHNFQDVLFLVLRVWETASPVLQLSDDMGYSEQSLCMTCCAVGQSL